MGAVDGLPGVPVYLQESDSDAYFGLALLGVKATWPLHQHQPRGLCRAF